MPKTIKTNNYSNSRKKQLKFEKDKEIPGRIITGYIVSALTIIGLSTFLSIIGFLNIDVSRFAFIPPGIIGLFSAFVGPKLNYFFKEKRSDNFCISILSFGISLLFIIIVIILVY